MKEFTNLDFMYPVVGLIVAMIMMFSPRSLMRKVKITEESIKAEGTIRKAGYVFLAIVIAFAVYIYIKIPR